MSSSAALAGQRRDHKAFALPAAIRHEAAARVFALLFGGSRSSLFSTSQRGFSNSASSYFLSSVTIAFASLHRIRSVVERRDVDQVQQQARALQVAQELMAEARRLRPRLRSSPGMSAITKLRSLVDAHDAEIRMQRRERIVRDFRPRGRDRADEGRLAGVRHAEQADVGEHLELELELARFARLAARELARRAIGARFEVDVAQAALAALREQRASASCSARSAMSSPVSRSVMTVPTGTRKHDVVAPLAVAVRARARSRRSSRDGCARSGSRPAC